MNEHYCRSCYRTLPAEHAICFSCNGRGATVPGVSRVPLVLGCAGIPMLILGMFAHNTTLCLAGGIVSAAAVIVHALLALR